MGKFEHKCQLTLEHDTLLSSLTYKYIRRKLFLISSNENHRKIFRLSQYGVEMERIRHLQTHPYVIHPFSSFRYYWELIMMIIFLIRIFDVSYFIFKRSDLYLTNILQIYAVITHMVYFLDFNLNFATGIFDNNKYKIVLNPKIYIKRYIFSYALVDFLSCAPLELVYNFIHGRANSAMTPFAFCKLLYVFRFINYLNRFREKKEYALHKFKIWQTIAIYVLILAYAISFLGIANVLENNILFSMLSYESCVSAAVNMVFGAPQFPVITNWTELLMHVLGRIIGITLGIIFIAQVVTYILCRYNSKFKYNTHMKELEEYMYSKEFPLALKEKFLAFQNWYYQQEYFHEGEIWALVSNDMRCNTLYDILKLYLQKSMFYVCTKEIHLIIVSQMHKKLFLPGDILYHANTYNNLLFIIHTGSVQLLTDDDYEVAIINEGKLFVDIIPQFAEIYETQRRFTVIAREYIIVYTLKLWKLFDLLVEYPNVQKQIITELERKTNVILNSPKHILDLNEYYKRISPNP